jgi:hypothetical protein
MLTIHLQLAPRLRMSGSILLLLQYAFMMCEGKNFKSTIDSFVHFTKFTIREVCLPSRWLTHAAAGRYESPFLKGCRPPYYHAFGQLFIIHLFKNNFAFFLCVFRVIITNQK